MCATMESMLSGCSVRVLHTSSPSPHSHPHMVRISPIRSTCCIRSSLGNSRLLRAQQLHMRLQYSVNLSWPTCAAHQSHLLRSPHLVFSVLRPLSVSFVFTADFELFIQHWVIFHVIPPQEIWTESLVTLAKPNRTAKLDYFDAIKIRTFCSRIFFSHSLFKLSVEYHTALLLTGAISVLYGSTSVVFCLCLSSGSQCWLLNLPEHWEFGDGNSFSSVCLVKSVAGWGDWCWQPWGYWSCLYSLFSHSFPHFFFHQCSAAAVCVSSRQLSVSKTLSRHPHSAPATHRRNRYVSEKLVASHVTSYRHPSVIIITIGGLLLSYDESRSGKWGRFKRSKSKEQNW